jgi:Na+/melibiose symporter-like transporter
MATTYNSALVKFSPQGSEMKSSLYTNCMLTVIALSLVYLCVARVTQPPAVQAEAAQYTVPVMLNGSNDGPPAFVPVAVFDAKWKNGTWQISSKP